MAYNLSQEATGDAARIDSEVVRYEWVNKIVAGHTPAAQLKTVMRLKSILDVLSAKRGIE